MHLAVYPRNEAEAASPSLYVLRVREYEVYSVKGIFPSSSLSFTVIPDVHLLGGIMFPFSSILAGIAGDTAVGAIVDSGDHSLLKRLAQGNLGEARCFQWLSLYFGPSFLIDQLLKAALRENCTGDGHPWQCICQWRSSALNCVNVF